MQRKNTSEGVKAPTNDTAERLRVLYTDPAGHMGQGSLTKLGRILFPLARRIGIDNPQKIRWQERHTIYARAAAGGLIDEATEKQLRELLDDLETQAERSRQMCDEMRAEAERRGSGRRPVDDLDAESRLELLALGATVERLVFKYGMSYHQLRKAVGLFSVRIALKKASDNKDEAAKMLRMDPKMLHLLTYQKIDLPASLGGRDPDDEEEAQRPGRRLYSLTVKDSHLEHLGLVKGDEADVYAADLKPGDPAALHLRGCSEIACGRVVYADAKQITLRADDGTDRSVRRGLIASTGRIDVHNARQGDALTPEQRQQVKEYRGLLARLGREDDQIIRCSERYRLEKLIYDIEHPAGDNSDDWSAWEKDGRRER